LSRGPVHFREKSQFDSQDISTASSESYRAIFAEPRSSSSSNKACIFRLYLDLTKCLLANHDCEKSTQSNATKLKNLQIGCFSLTRLSKDSENSATRWVFGLKKVILAIKNCKLQIMLHPSNYQQSFDNELTLDCQDCYLGSGIFQAGRTES